MKVNAYIDESGNTGLQLYDPRQPVYAIASVSVSEQQTDTIDRIFKEAKKKFRLQGSELKGSRLVSSPNGQRAIRHLAEELSKSEIIISTLVVHKPYHAVGWIIHDCFDYAHNSSVTAQWTWDRRLRIPAQNAIMRLVHPQTLALWWHARISSDATGMRESICKIVKELSIDEYGRELGHLLMGFDAEDLAETSRLKASSFSEPKKQYGISPNVTAFIGFIQLLDEDAQEMNISNISVIHDEQKQFSESLLWWAKLTGNLENKHIDRDRNHMILPDGLIMPSIPLISIKNFAFAQSIDQPGIQLADCFASLSRIVGEYAFRDEINSIPPILRQALLHLRPSPSFPESVGPTSWQRDTLRLLSGASTLIEI
jgi:hypothetical protein